MEEVHNLAAVGHRSFEEEVHNSGVVVRSLVEAVALRNLAVEEGNRCAADHRGIRLLESRTSQKDCTDPKRSFAGY